VYFTTNIQLVSRHATAVHIPPSIFVLRSRSQITDIHTQRRCEQESLEYTNTHTKLRISTETGFYIVGQRNGVQFIDWPLGYHDNKIEMRKEVPFSTGAALVAHFHSGFIEKMDD
jgi:hypothetical protein